MPSHSNPYAKRIDAVSDFISKQSIIRVLFDGGPGSGNQASSLNVMKRLKAMGFTGTFELIFPDIDAQKLSVLFNLPENLPKHFSSDYWGNITFITEEEHVTALNRNEVELCNLAVTGAYDTSNILSCEYEILDCKNIAGGFAQFTHSKVFLSLKPWFVDPNNPDPRYAAPASIKRAFKDEWLYDKLYTLHSENHYSQSDPSNTFYVMPLPTLHQTKNYLNNEPEGQKILFEKPALRTFIEGMEEKRFHVLSAYGYTLEYALPMDILAGLRYAQLFGPPSMRDKALVIAMFSSYKAPNRLNQLLNDDNWLADSDLEQAGWRSITNDLHFKGNFSTANVKDVNTVTTLQQLKPATMLILLIDSLPKQVFDGIFAHGGWPPIREGQSSLNMLALTGTPHFRCGETGWEIGFDLVKDMILKDQLETLYDYSNGLCHRNTNIYPLFGELVIAANQPNSTLSQYFVTLRNEALKPENDRIANGLYQAIQLLPESNYYEIPATQWERFIANAKPSAQHGVLRGCSTILVNALQKRGIPANQAKLLSSVAYYWGYFNLKYFNYYRQETYDHPNAYPLLQAMIDTGQLFLLNMTLEAFNQTLSHVSEKLQRNHWTSLAKNIKKLSSLTHFGIFAYNAQENGVLETSTSIIAGTLSQMATERIGKLITH